jgi:hypothetical protein
MAKAKAVVTRAKQEAVNSLEALRLLMLDQNFVLKRWPKVEKPLSIPHES